jgi:hypothetical protein
LLVFRFLGHDSGTGILLTTIASDPFLVIRTRLRRLVYRLRDYRHLGFRTPLFLVTVASDPFLVIRTWRVRSLFRCLNSFVGASRPPPAFLACRWIDPLRVLVTRGRAA